MNNYEVDFYNEKKEKTKKFYPIVDVHATWLVLNPIQGCPKKCKYCFLGERGLNQVEPTVLVEPEEAVKILLDSKFYIEDIPLCLFSQTDAFATPNNIEYAKKLIKILMEKDIKNPIVFITKYQIPEDFIEFIDYYEKKGKNFLFFLSYSGLKNDVEVGVNKKNIEGNFITLSKYNKKIIHYWRPLIPENSKKEVIDEVYNFVKKYCVASVAIGLKITEDIINNIGWKELIDNKENAMKVNNVWHRDAYDYIWGSLINNKEKYPIFQTTACAVVYALGQPDRKFFYNTDICVKWNRCSKEQRDLCKKKFEKFQYPSKEHIVELIGKLGQKIKLDQINFNKRMVFLEGIELRFNEISFLTESLGMKISVIKRKNDYYWNSEIINPEILKI